MAETKEPTVMAGSRVVITKEDKQRMIASIMKVLTREEKSELLRLLCEERGGLVESPTLKFRELTQ